MERRRSRPQTPLFSLPFPFSPFPSPLSALRQEWNGKWKRSYLSRLLAIRMRVSLCLSLITLVASREVAKTQGPPPFFLQVSIHLLQHCIALLAAQSRLYLRFMSSQDFPPFTYTITPLLLSYCKLPQLTPPRLHRIASAGPVGC